jgi:hypothetical protein
VESKAQKARREGVDPGFSGISESQKRNGKTDVSSPER